MRNLIETVAARLNVRIVLPLVIFGAPIVMLFVKGGQLVEAASK